VSIQRLAAVDYREKIREANALLMKPIEPLYSAISALLVSIVVGLILTVPFYLVVPRESLAVNLSFWGIHAIMLQTFLIWRTLWSINDPESTNAGLNRSRDFAQDPATVFAIVSMVFALIGALIVATLVTIPFSLWRYGYSDTTSCIFVLSTLACQSVLFSIELTRRRRSSK
jgi:hypothetical protein